MPSPPVHRAILEPIETKDIQIFNVRFGMVTIKGKPSPVEKSQS